MPTVRNAISFSLYLSLSLSLQCGITYGRPDASGLWAFIFLFVDRMPTPYNEHLVRSPTPLSQREIEREWEGDWGVRWKKERKEKASSSFLSCRQTPLCLIKLGFAQHFLCQASSSRSNKSHEYSTSPSVWMMFKTQCFEWKILLCCNSHRLQFHD